MIAVVAKCCVLGDHWQNYEGHDMVGLTLRRDPGYTRYEVMTSVEEPGLFVVLKKWVNKNHLNAHLAISHIMEHFTRISGWYSEPVKLSLYDVSIVENITVP